MRPHLFETFPEELDAWLQERGVESIPEYTRRIVAEVVARGRDDIRPPNRPMPKRVSEPVREHFDWHRLEVVERVEDEVDGFVKYLLRSPDGALSEAVRIPLKKEGAYSVCLSSQVGCAMGCVFCATGRLGLTRHLEAWEMVAAFLTVRDEAPGRATGAVFQGQGEPLHNYERVIRAARMLCHPCGGRIAAKSITISTVGLVPAIRRFTSEGHKFRLILSLTSALPERRAELLPVAGNVPIEDLVAAIRDHATSAPFGLQTVAWVVMGGVNHDAAEVDALQRLFEGLPIRINLIDINGPRNSADYRRASDDEMSDLIDRLQALRMPIVRRYSGGAQRHAACGMLAARQFAEDVPSG